VGELGSGERIQLGRVIWLPVSLDRLKRIGFDRSDLGRETGASLDPLAFRNLARNPIASMLRSTSCFVEGFASLPRCMDWGIIEL
jgi:hypothetical protein